MDHPGARLRKALTTNQPLPIAGTINAYTALLAQHAGFQAIYLSGAGVANASYGLPDLAITTLNDVLEDTRRITDSCSLPLLVDIDTGWGTTLNIARAIHTIAKAGAAGVHIEDQVFAKRCGHHSGKKLIRSDEMVERIQAAKDAKTHPDFILMARTDALAVEGLQAAIDRACCYVAAGADMIFFEGATELSQYQALSLACQAPILANMTEFGVTPLFTRKELGAAGVSLALYPLTAFRAMSATALHVYQTLLREESQKSLLPSLQTREDLYKILHYKEYE